MSRSGSSGITSTYPGVPRFHRIDPEPPPVAAREDPGVVCDSRPPACCGWLHPGELMSRIFITGSTDGLGLMAAELLLKDGHQVTLHARSQARAADARTRLPGADAVVIGDLSAIESMR